MSVRPKTFFALAWRNLWRNGRRTWITLVVVSVGMWSILFFSSFMNAWIDAGKESALGLLTGSGQIHANGYLDDPGIDYLMPPPGEALLGALASDGVEDWAARLPVPGVVQSEYKTLPITIVGVDPDAENRVSTIPGKLSEGRYLSDPSDASVVIGMHLAERLETGLGRRVILMSPGRDGELAEQSFDVVGVFDADKGTEEFFLFTGLTAAQEFVGVGTEIGQIVTVLSAAANLETEFQAIQTSAPDLDVRTWKDLNILLAATDTGMKTFIGIWLGVVFSLMAIGIMNTQLMAVFERTREFGLLRALGLKPRQLLMLVALESALLVGVGVILGASLAVLNIWAMRGGLDLSAFGRALEMMQSGNVLYLEFQPATFVQFALLIWVLGVIVALLPARRAARANPVDAMIRKT